jgi:hypothetical protein
MPTPEQWAEMGEAFRIDTIDGGAVRIELRTRRNDSIRRWAVVLDGLECLTRDGQWVPDSRGGSVTDEFVSRCQYATKDEAWTKYWEWKQSTAAAPPGR